MGSLTAAMGQARQPAGSAVPRLPGWKIYWVIVNGKNAMPSHAADLTETQRWAVVHYVRALQRAQNAKDED